MSGVRMPHTLILLESHYIKCTNTYGFKANWYLVLVIGENENLIYCVIVYRVVWVLKPFESFCLKPSIFWENCIKLKFLGIWDTPENFTIDLCIRPSSGHILWNLYLSFKLILRRFEVVFWCLEWECCPFWKTDWNSSKSTKAILWL